jgi:hypothetical protein
MLAIGCFLEAQIQGLLFGDERWKTAGMSRPKADLQVSLKQPYARTDFFWVLHLRSSRSWPPVLGQKRSSVTCSEFALPARLG